MLLLFVFLQIFKIDWWIDLQKCDVGVRANIVCLSSFSELAALLEKDKLALHLLTECTYIGGVASTNRCFCVVSRNLSVYDPIWEHRLDQCQKVNLREFTQSASEGKSDDSNIKLVGVSTIDNWNDSQLKRSQRSSLRSWRMCETASFLVWRRSCSVASWRIWILAISRSQASAWHRWDCISLVGMIVLELLFEAI